MILEVEDLFTTGALYVSLRIIKLRKQHVVFQMNVLDQVVMKLSNARI